jgi:hypothetical protein
MTLSLAIGIIFYQDAAGLKRLVESLEPLDPYVSSIYAVDGRFVGPDYGSAEDPELSNDLGDFNNIKLKIISLPNKKEWYKRQAYLEECYNDRPDFLLVLDSDEYLHVDDINEFEKSLLLIKQLDNPLYIYHNVYDVRFIDKVEKMENTKPRLWFRPNQMEYTKDLTFRNKRYISYHTDPTGSQYAIGLIKGISIIHDKTCS